MKRWIHRLFVPLTLVLVLGSCDPVPTAPDTSATPQLHVGDGSHHVVDTEGNEYEIITGDAPIRSRHGIVTGLIGTLGGTLSLAGHTLQVPAGSVLEPTLFSLQVMDNGYVEIELRATLIQRIWRWLLGLIFRIIDVGSLGFEKPVTIEMTYSYANNVEDPRDLVILRMQDDDPNHEKPHELIPSEVDVERKVVRAQLDHFTKYCMASN